jgi:hypothetical protein
MRAARLVVFVALVLTGAAIVFVSVTSFASAGTFGVAWTQVIGEGETVADSRSVGAFHAIKSSGSAEVHIRVGGSQAVVVHAQSNILPLIDTSIEDGTLVIGSHSSFSTNRQTVVDVVVPNLDAFDLTGSGDVTIDGVHADTFSVALHGSGKIQASGTAGRLDLHSTGSGETVLDDLNVRDAVVRVSGSGDARLHVANTLDVEISGSGDVRYSGSAHVINERVRGTGDVSHV